MHQPCPEGQGQAAERKIRNPGMQGSDASVFAPPIAQREGARRSIRGPLYSIQMSSFCRRDPVVVVAVGPLTADSEDVLEIKTGLRAPNFIRDCTIDVHGPGGAAGGERRQSAGSEDRRHCDTERRKLANSSNCPSSRDLAVCCWRAC